MQCMLPLILMPSAQRITAQCYSIRSCGYMSTIMLIKLVYNISCYKGSVVEYTVCIIIIALNSTNTYNNVTLYPQPG